MAPATIVQLTDPHLGAAWSPDPAGALRRALAAIPAVLGGRPDALLVTGDVANTPLAAEYAEAAALLAGAGVPILAVPGNHDDPRMLSEHLGQPIAPTGDVRWSHTVGAMRIIGLDTTVSGEAGGALGGERLAWLQARLAEAPETPTLLVMHHPPIETGMPAMDAIGIPAPDRRALAELLRGAPAVQAIAAGHVHRAIVGALAGVPVLAIPSTDVQLRLDLHGSGITFAAEPPCFAVHILAGGRLVSHLQPIAGER